MEPERKIEKLLRAYAQKRRGDAGDPLKLHPANRHALQSEAASTLRSGTATGDGRHSAAPEEGGKDSLFLLFFAVFRRRLVFALSIVAIAFLGASLLLPSLNSAKHRAQSLGAMSNLREIGVATRQFAEDNKEVLPASLNEVTNVLNSGGILFDPATGKPFVYAGAGKKLDELQSNTVLAYSAGDEKHHAVLFADGRVETVTGARLTELTNQIPVEFALADKAGREQTAEIPATAAPAVAATPAVTPPVLEVQKLAESKEQLNTTASGAPARSVSEPARRQLEIAKSEPVATPAPIGATSLGEVESTSSLNGSISGKLPALENSGALSQNRFYDRLVAQTNSSQLNFAASQNFVQAGVSGLQNNFKNNVSSAQATPVLQSFQMQQNGNAISVVDRDGSVYLGSARPETVTVRNEPASADSFATAGALPRAQDKPGQAAENQQSPNQNYFFRVAGMNRTLNQKVVFTGNFVANTVSPQTAQVSNSFGAFGGTGGGGGGAGTYQIQPSAANTSQQNLLSNSRIVGTAVIANTNQIEINAVPVTQ